MSAGARLRDAIERALPRLRRLSDTEAAIPPAAGKWSPKEVIGHLIDSASNNHQRFVRAQFTEELTFPGYEQAGWVDVQRYRDAPWDELVTLWQTFNLHLGRFIEAMPAAIALKPRVAHNLDQISFHPVPREQPATLAYFMDDYVSHLEHHLAQIA